MLDQEDDPELDDEWLTADEQLTSFRKVREKIVGGMKGIESPYVKVPQSSDEDLVVRERVTSRTEIPSVREPDTYGNHAPIGQAHNGGSSANSQDIPVSMDNVCTDRNGNQYVTSPSGEALGRNVNVRRSERIRNSPQRYNPWFGAAREWKNDAVASIVYIIQDRDFDSNLDTDDILSLLAEWDAEDCMDTPSMFHMRKYYALKTQSHDPDTPTYMEALSREIWKNTLMQWMMKSKVLWEGTHRRLFQGIHLLITMCFQEHGLSSARENLIGQLGNSRHDIV